MQRFFIGVMKTEILKLYQKHKAQFYKPMTNFSWKAQKEFREALAECKRKKQCSYCGSKYRIKDFKTRKEKDERDISGMCPACIQKAYEEEIRCQKKTKEYSII